MSKKTTVKKPATKKTVKKKPVRKMMKMDIEQILLEGRQLFLYGDIDINNAKDINQRLMALDKVRKSPIIMWINSYGGSVTAGYSIIDTMRGMRSEVITVVSGVAASMAGLIAISGHKRVISEHSVWMAHDIAAGICDYASKIIDRAEFLKQEQVRFITFLSEHTKLSQAELEKAIRGELWLYAEDCVRKGVADGIVD